MKKYLLITIVILAVFAVSSFVLAACDPTSGTICNPLNVDTIAGFIEQILNAVTILIGALSAIMITFAGILYLISGGSTEKMTTARKALFGAIIGIIVAVLARTIVLVIQEIIGVSF